MSWILSAVGIEIILAVVGTALGILGIPGLIYSIKSFHSAHEAEKQSRANYDLLYRSNLVYQGKKSDFTQIYRDYILSPLDRARNEEGSQDVHIQLMLSTPAYGFGAVEENDVERYVNLISECARHCQLDMILHSPEFHWTYWANVLLWSASRDLVEYRDRAETNLLLDGSGKSDAVKFARGICDFHRRVGNSPDEHFRLWIGNNLNVRMYAYDFKDKVDGQIRTELYIANTDAISLMFAQFGRDGFQAVASRVPTDSVELYINDSQSQFERQKICHYLNDLDANTGRQTGQVQRDEISPLFGDYVFGRTAFSAWLARPDRGVRYLELLVQVIWHKTQKLMLERRKPDQLSLGSLTKMIAQHVLHYFSVISRKDTDNALFGLLMDEPQGEAIAGTLKEFCKTDHEFAFGRLFDHTIELLKAIPEDQLETDGSELERVLTLLQGLLTSGVRLSVYGNARIERARREMAELQGRHV